MARGILSEYGPDASKSMAGRATSGGVKTAKPLPYSEPTGRASSTSGPGLGGSNLGNCGTQGTHSTGASSSGSPGIGGTNRGNSGSQR